MTTANLGITVTSNADQAAVDLDKLTASSGSAERAVESLSTSARQTATATRQMEQAFEAASITNSRASAAMQANAAMLQSYSVSAGNARMQTQNLMFQMQDIGMMMAMGQNPFTLLAQQLPQVTQYGGRLNGVMAALRGTLAGIFSPLGLLTTGFVLAGSYAISYFTSLLNDGRDSNEVLEEQRDLITRVAERWGSTTPALKAVADELERIQRASDIQQAVGGAIQQEFAALREQMPDLLMSLAEAQVDLQALGASSTEIANLRGAFDDFSQGVEDGSASTEDLDRVLSILASTTGSETVPSLINLQGVLGGVAAALANAAAAANSFRLDAAFASIENAPDRDIFNTRDFIAEQERLNGLTTEQLNLEREIGRIRSAAEDAGATNLLSNETEITRLAQERLAAEERRAEIARESRKAISSGQSSVDQWGTSTENFQERIDQMWQEIELTGQTTYEMERQKAAFDLLSEAKAAGIPITEAVTEQINSMAASYAEASIAMQSVSMLLQPEAMPWDILADQMAGLDAALAQGAISWAQYGEAAQRAHMLAASSTLGAVGQITSTLAGAFENNKAFAVANAVINTAEGVTKALAQGGMFAFPMAAAIAAAGAAQIASIMSAKPGSSNRPSVGGAPAGAAAAPVAPPEPSRTINVTLGGNGRYSRDEVRDLLEQLTGELNDGAGTKFKMAVNS